MKEKVLETLAGLKDFQLKTVEYVYDQLYVNGRTKMLIADEVGLGKTIVAKGIIAKAFDQFQPTPQKKVFNVVYICSNQALAKQNLKKLNFTGNNIAIDYSDDDDRLTGLAYSSLKDENALHFRIKAFTPATSFDDKTHAGKADERLLLYRLLYKYSDIAKNKNSLKWILKGGVSDHNWNVRINDMEDKEQRADPSLRSIRQKVYSEFRKVLETSVHPTEMPKSFEAIGYNHPLKLWTLLDKICQLQITARNYSDYKFSKELISRLRFILSRACLEFLQADIFILDEFQRFKKLIDKTGSQSKDKKEKITPAIQLARDIFNFEGSKILMLSATPFKPYTNGFDQLNGEVHYNEFVTVLEFLMADKTVDFWKEYENDRKALFNYLRHPDTLQSNISEAVLLKEKIENLYRTSIVRTEKLLASNTRDAMIKHVNAPLDIQSDDINDFVALDQITVLLNTAHNASLAVPLEYVKSCPFALSFLDNYQHKEKIKLFIQNDLNLRKLVQKTKHGWVNLDNINNYKPLIPHRGVSLPNAKLRLLLNQTVLNGGWKYLWIPPSTPYYELQGAFENSWGYSKTLIFSSWKMVPKMVATLVSYEAERLSVGDPKSISEREKQDDAHLTNKYFSKKNKRSPRPQFTFRVQKEDQEPKEMNSFILTYPCLFLADLYDPASNFGKKLKSSTEIITALKIEIAQLFEEHALNDYVTGDGDWQKWQWLAPLLFDKTSKGRTKIAEWFSKGIPSSQLALDTENEKIDVDEDSGKRKHYENAKSAFFENGKISAPKLEGENLDKLCTHLAELTIASPAICYLRSQKRHFQESVNLLDGSYNVASAFLAMFNKPESIALVRITTGRPHYWQGALQYMVDGNIQAMLDEFVYLLVSGENIQSAKELSDFITDILSTRTTTHDIEDYPTFIKNINQKKADRKMRSHYAADFGTQRINTASGAGRQINVRQAFNSPFRPFVLASTSIGQEGLDFHLYCKKIFHWNLPSNPIDFEQREGRIHRYQGFVIRQNLAKKYCEQVSFKDETNNVWRDLFKYSEKEKSSAKFPCDLVPFWHTETENDIKIERFVPLYPFSKDIEKFANLMKILTFYRLTFGQPRQEELVDALHSSGFKDEDIRRLDNLMINLSPISFLGKTVENVT